MYSCFSYISYVGGLRHTPGATEPSVRFRLTSFRRMKPHSRSGGEKKFSLLVLGSKPSSSAGRIMTTSTELRRL
jgi:hypothetical protein